MPKTRPLDLAMDAHPIWEKTRVGYSEQKCTHCWGMGQLYVKGQQKVCRCVLRSVFRTCYYRFRECVVLPPKLRTASYSVENRGANVYFSGSFLNQEYIADFTLVAKRVLQPQHYRIFSAHFLLGADWKLCCARFRIKRGDFFHAVYNIEERLGKALAEQDPYPLFPVEQYFGADRRTKQHQTAPGKTEIDYLIEEHRVLPLRAPLRRAGRRRVRALMAAGAE